MNFAATEIRVVLTRRKELQVKVVIVKPKRKLVVADLQGKVAAPEAETLQIMVAVKEQRVVVPLLEKVVVVPLLKKLAVAEEHLVLVVEEQLNYFVRYIYLIKSQ